MRQDKLLKVIKDTLTKSVQQEIAKVRPSRAYDGRFKPISGKKSTVYANRINSGNLYRSVSVNFVQNPDDGSVKLDLAFPGAPEWEYVNYGRRGVLQGAKYPPLRAILEWTIERRLPQFRDDQGRFMSNLQRAYLVQRSIGYYGIYPTNFVNDAYRKVAGQLRKELGDYAVEFFNQLIQEGVILRNNLPVDQNNRLIL